MPVSDRPYLQSPGPQKLGASDYSEVYAFVPMGISQDYRKPQNNRSPPRKDLDMALKKWAWPPDERAGKAEGYHPRSGIVSKSTGYKVLQIRPRTYH
jgi:hypothetical protein